MDSPLSSTGTSEGCPDGCVTMFGSRKQRDTDSDLAAFSSLSLEERETALEELHGVAGDMEETPELIQGCLSQMRKELSRFHGRKRKHWDRACFLSPTLEKNDKHLLIFLRGERYNPRQAAEKLALHYEHKAELFPVDALPRRVTLEDLDEDDIQCMRNGAIQPQKRKDQTGRTIIVIDFSKVNCKHWKNELRYWFYQVMSVLADEDTQVKGVVDVIKPSGMTFSSKAIDMIRNGGHILSAFSVRRVGLHVCHCDPVLRQLIRAFGSVIPHESQVRQRFHFGSGLECDYALRSYGIRVDESLWNESKDMSAHTNLMEQYIRERREIEADWKRQEVLEASGKIPYPKRLDVLVGRGRPYQEFPGNARLAAVVAAFSMSYSRSVDRMEKTVMSLHVVQNMKDSGSRFLRRKGDCWEAVEDSVAREKVVHALRILARKQQQS
eukprot:Nitzschia sp. Nitz4//scaffold64_size103689//1117//2497//NITZ4_004419-RA/size103689-exonerate_est2genome-gene-0.89-mRNA-1//-1//CDS//3329556079//7402//frame0